MEQDFLSLLQKADSSTFGENPFWFSVKKAHAKFDKFVDTLEHELNCSLPEREILEGLQDTSIHGSVKLPLQFLTDNSVITIRASNFGNFTTVFDDDSFVQPIFLSTIIKTLQQFDYVYIPSEILNLSYTGNHPGVDGFKSWQHRFFDYL